MSAHLFCFSAKGRALCDKIEKFLQEKGYEVTRQPSTDLAARTRECFQKGNLLIFVCACGIAVRAIAPLVRDKTEDPAVLVCDDCGNFVISLLSGQIGGANRAAVAVAEFLGATPVVTTATDRNGKFAVDEFAAMRGYLISDMKLARAVSSAILERDLPFFSDLPYRNALPQGLKVSQGGEPLGIALSYREKAPFLKTLFLRPRVLTLGIGCRRGTSAEKIGRCVEEVFCAEGLNLSCIAKVASVDLKADERGLLEFCERQGLPTSFYTAAELSALHGNFTHSERVLRVTGTDNVCERAAVCGGEKLLVAKKIVDGVTVAVGLREEYVTF